jgi:hypothetical protein
MFYRTWIASIALVASAACTDTESATNLHTSGPPSIEQVRLDEAILSGPLPAFSRVFAFGTFPGADPSIEHHVTSGHASKNVMRIVFGKLLLGNYLEQIQCRAPVRIDTDGTPTAFDNVPVGATPDDIAKCCVTSDVLAKTCTGPLATCICALPQGCMVNGTAFDPGQPVGILDENNDGAADFHRFIPDAVALKCTAPGSTVNVAPDTSASYYWPSGDQQADYECTLTAGNQPPCYDDIGPAIVWQPVSVPANAGASSVPFLPTNMDCGLVFSPDVVDHANVQPCAAPEGRPAACEDVNLDKCTLDQQCTPGDVSAFSFHTEPLTVHLVGIDDGAVGVSRASDIVAQSGDSVTQMPLDPGSIANITMTENGVPFAGFTVTLTAPTKVTIHPTGVTGLAPTAMYVITFQTTFADFYHQGLPAPVSIGFTTGP